MISCEKLTNGRQVHNWPLSSYVMLCKTLFLIDFHDIITDHARGIYLIVLEVRGLGLEK